MSNPHPNGKTTQKTSSKTPEQMNMPFSQTNSWTNGENIEIFKYLITVVDLFVFNYKFRLDEVKRFCLLFNRL